jgi:hypothetical protein
VDKPTGHAFISYVREDSHEIDRLQRTLEEAGIAVWRDTRDLWPGEDWRAKIRRAITDNALVFIACFSSRSVARVKSYQNEELRLAIDELRQRRPDDPWLIPVRFDDCVVPDLELGGGRTLASIQRVDLFGIHREAGFVRLVLAVLRILGQRSESIRGEQPVGVRLNIGTTDESKSGSAAPLPRTSQRFGEQSYRSTAEPTGTAASTKMVEPLKLSGRDSKLLEVDLPPGRYRLSWNRGGKGYLDIRDESERGGKGSYLVQVMSNHPDSGEKVVRIEEEGRHLLSVGGNSLNWEFTFTPIISQDQSAAKRNERTARGESMEAGSETEALELLKKTPLVVSGTTSKVLELDLPRGRYRVSWTAEGSGTLNVKQENAKHGSGYIVGEMIPNPGHGEKFVSIHETGRQIISVYCWATVTAWELKFMPL